MTKNLGKINELKFAIDTLTPIQKALLTLFKYGIITHDQTLTDKITAAKNKLETLKKEK